MMMMIKTTSKKIIVTILVTACLQLLSGHNNPLKFQPASSSRDGQISSSWDAPPSVTAHLVTPSAQEAITNNSIISTAVIQEEDNEDDEDKDDPGDEMNNTTAKTQLIAPIQEFVTNITTTPTPTPTDEDENNSTINIAAAAIIIAQEEEEEDSAQPEAAATGIPQKNDSQKIPSQSQQQTQSQQPQQPQFLIPRNEKSTIASDIVQIWHETDSHEICVELKQDARCPHPDLVGRLSGPSLAILEWKERRQPTDNANGTTVLCGAYDHYWLDADDYFVEIVILHCKDFGVTALMTRQNNNNNNNNLTDAWLEADNRLECPEDAKRNVLTASNNNNKDGSAAKIRIPVSIKGRGNYRLGRWVRKPDYFPSRPLSVRYQPIECFKYKNDGSPLQRYCDSVTKRDLLPINITKKNNNNKDGRTTTTTTSRKATGLYEYEFQWNIGISEEALLQKLRQRLRIGGGGDKNKNKLNNNLPKVCGIGDSHTRFMRTRTLKHLELEGIFEYAVARFPDPYGIAKVVKKSVGDDCDVFFSQVAQWTASWMTLGKPWTFGRFYEYIKLHIKNVLKGNPNATFYMPANDKNPLMYKIINCTDWRLSTYMDAFSHVTKRAIQELNIELNATSQVRYLDIDFIVYPHWDGSPDWQHLSDNVRARKTIYMLAVMLGELEWSDSDREMSTILTPLIGSPITPITTPKNNPVSNNNATSTITPAITSD